MFQEGCSIKIF